MMTRFPLLVLCVALAGALPVEDKGRFENCEWKKSDENSQLYDVTCGPGQISNPASVGTINVRTRVTTPSPSDHSLPIHTLDVDLSTDLGVGIEISPDFLNKDLSQLITLILRGDEKLSFGESESSSKHGLINLEVHNSSIEEIREHALKGFDTIQRVSFTSVNASDIVENAFTGHERLESLTFTDCHFGEFEGMAISNNPSLTFVEFKGNKIDEFSSESIVGTKGQNRRCSVTTINNEQREVPVWNFIDNDINKIDKEAIKIELVGEITFSGNKIDRMKSKALRVNVGVAECKSGKVIISNNKIKKVDEKGFAIVDQGKSSKDAALVFTGNVISYSRDPFLPSSFKFDKDQLTVADNVFPCKCENSGHSWFIPALDTVNEPLHAFYKKLWSTGYCYEDENRMDNRKRLSQSPANDCHPNRDIPDATPDPDATEMPPTAQPHDSNKPSSAASISHISSVFVSLSVLFACVSAM